MQMSKSTPILLIVILSLVGSFAFRLSIPAVAFYARSALEASALGVGLLTSLFFLARASSALFSGRLMDRWGASILYVVAASFGLNSIVTYLYSYSHEIWQVLLLRFLQGALNGLAWIPVQVSLGVLAKPSVRGRLYAIYFIFGTFGVMLGNFVYSLMAEQPLNVILLISAFAFAASSAIALVISYSVRPLHLYTLTASPKGYGIKLSGLSGSVVIILLVVFSAGMFNSVVTGDLIYIYVNEYIGVERAAVAYYIAISSFVGLIAGYFISWGADILGSFRALKVSLALSLIGALTLSVIFRGLVMPALTLIYSGLFGVIPIARKVGVSVEKDKGIVIGLVNAFTNAGNVLGAALAGYLYDSLTVKSLHLAMTSVSTLMLIMTSPILASLLIAMTLSKD